MNIANILPPFAANFLTEHSLTILTGAAVGALWGFMQSLNQLINAWNSARLSKSNETTSLTKFFSSLNVGIEMGRTVWRVLKAAFWGIVLSLLAVAAWDFYH